MKRNLIVVKDVVSGTSTNTEAIPLYTLMDNAISNDTVVVLSLKNCTPLSSSFLNSSIGAIVEKHGLDTLKGKLVISDYTPAMATVIKNYIACIKQLVH